MAKYLRRIFYAIVISAIGLWALFAYLNLDKTQAFLDVAGQLGRVETVTVRQTAGSDVKALKLYNTRGEYLVDCLYRRPRTLARNYRTLILYSGVKTKAAILDLIPDRPDLVVCSVQYPYERPRKFFEYVRWPYTTRRTAFQVVGGGILATTFLIEREHLDTSSLTAVGASLGSIFGVIHGALDERVPRVLIVHGGGNFPAIVRAHKRLYEKRRPVGLYAWLGDRVFGAFDPLRYADRIAPRELVILAATDDKYFPPESAQSLYDRAGTPKQLLWMSTEHVKSQKSDIVDSILDSLNTYLFPDTAADRILRLKLGRP